MLANYGFRNGPDLVFQVNIGDPPPCAKVEEKWARRATPSKMATFKNLNSGLYFLRSNPATIEWLTDAIHKCAANKVGVWCRLGVLCATHA